MDPQDVQMKFFEFWSDFWDRPPPPDSILLDSDRIPPEWRLQHRATLTYEGVLDALQRTNPDTSPGADAWRVSELNVGPDMESLHIWCPSMAGIFYLHKDRSAGQTLQPDEYQRCQAHQCHGLALQDQL